MLLRCSTNEVVNMTDIAFPFLHKTHRIDSRDEIDNGAKTKNINVQGVSTLESPESNSRITAQTFEDLGLQSRLKTFENWPNNQISKRSLAEAGFVYTGIGDIVECPICQVEGYRWASGDNPMEDHRGWDPDCPFVRRNIEHDHSEENTGTLDTCGLYGIEILPNSVPEDNKLDYNKLGIHRIQGALYEDKISPESRLATFCNWPKSLKQKPVDLAEAGFYYTGVGDQTLCFYCGGGLKDWEENDEPWEQHALWFSKCTFLILKKGLEFIEKVKREKDSLLSLPSSSEEPKEAKEVEAAAPTSNNSENVETPEAAEKTLCKICFKNELGVVFLPCGHIVACVDCAAALKTCAVCRKPLEATVRAFLS